MAQPENANPLVFQRSKERQILPEEEDDNVVDKIDDREVFGISKAHFFYRIFLILRLTFLSTLRTIELLFLTAKVVKVAESFNILIFTQMKVYYYFQVNIVEI